MFIQEELQSKGKAVDESRDKLNQVKAIHTSQCEELQHQIDILQEENSKMKMETRQVEEDRKKIQGEMDVKTTQIDDLEKALQDKQQVSL